LTAAQEFQSVASVIPSTDPTLPWWVSRFRLDLTIDASGKVAPMGSVGGEVRFRFEWHRMMKHHHAQPQVQPLTARQATIKSSLAEFVTATAYDLDHSFDEISHLGFKAHTMRMGIGISAKGNVGIAKGSAGIVGQIYFTRNVERPKVRPQSIDDDELDHPILMIERRPMMQHVLFAQQNQIPVKLNSASENNPIKEAVYQVDRKAFRKGLKKAANIGQFFAERASKNSQSSGWKIYELRTSFDASISGELDLVTLAGAVTAQIAFFNENF